VEPLIELALPDEVARDFVASSVPADGRKWDVVESLSMRSSSADVAALVVSAVNTGSAVVTLVVTGNTLRRLARKLLARRRPEDPDVVTLTLSRDGRSHSVTVNRTSPDAEDEALEFLATRLKA
jgi:hypothetical protein